MQEQRTSPKPRSGRPFERSDNVIGNPAAVKVALLRAGALPVYRGDEGFAKVEGHVALDRLRVARGMFVAPGALGHESGAVAPPGCDVKVGCCALELAACLARDGSEVVRVYVLTRKVPYRRVRLLADLHRADGVDDDRPVLANAEDDVAPCCRHGGWGAREWRFPDTSLSRSGCLALLGARAWQVAAARHVLGKGEGHGRSGGEEGGGGEEGA
eukprot:CAMPEP_0206057114 /NCGR_PEP_ID=MMETSP1466-20131121/43648_1 /ASSEMBLY_ACC=CAM_ASM_001126 /TAXON_ID=44452 /ORGANISM="Pavlova gyrans, Strain CCMP608" /LENGTH=213 /DNA_ID=CAMNT_0053432377 /DNA_START=174 /DNA_END=812 /DNA_ORIENTATION=-